MGLEFLQTRMGVRFFESDVPRALKAMEGIAEGLAQLKTSKVEELVDAIGAALGVDTVLVPEERFRAAVAAAKIKLGEG